MARRPIIAAVGGSKNFEEGKEFGREVTRRQWILLTGGELRDERDVARGGALKESSMLGAAEEGVPRRPARLVGIIPDGQPPPLPWMAEGRHFFLRTGLLHNIRNVINARTPDLVVAFGGGAGTLAEIAFALQAGRPVMVHRGWNRLQRNIERYFGRPLLLQEYLGDPLMAYPEAGDMHHLHALLQEFFATTAPAEVSAESLLDTIAQTLNVASPTGFPGLPGCPGSKDEFERVIRAISR
ncbi:hypothetical protein G5V57_27085 [Nordella sp. HKS 07]|uniref:SLOG cluster 4 domain-containing protein n=1 Tax=Nordella sp. HKS 07 TaxID=2712222 RepID=UPI0013E12CCC|nr:hypothetical protein [Nordella sp. HKS 07]QIG51069.1 hypothetical protein G5V57_27085 [Nordella sp. HKS 07]